MAEIRKIKVLKKQIWTLQTFCTMLQVPPETVTLYPEGLRSHARI